MSVGDQFFLFFEVYFFYSTFDKFCTDRLVRFSFIIFMLFFLLVVKDNVVWVKTRLVFRSVRLQLMKKLLVRYSMRTVCFIRATQFFSCSRLKGFSWEGSLIFGCYSADVINYDVYSLLPALWSPMLDYGFLISTHNVCTRKVLALLRNKGCPTGLKEGAQRCS